MDRRQYLSAERLFELCNEHLEDPRRPSGNIRHKLIDIFVIGLLGIMGGLEDWESIEDYGYTKQNWLKTFLELPNGMPSDDTYRRVFERLNPKQVEKVYREWVMPFVGGCVGKQVAIDGKTICGSGNAKHSAYHVVSAFVAENEITLGEIAVDEKSNEITAVPELLDLIDAENAIITADAMSCQKKIVSKIIEKKADYVIAVKENQPTLLHDIADWFADFSEEAEHTATHEKGHGRIEKREYYLLTDISWLEQRSDWCGLHGIGAVQTTVTENEETTVFTRYFITSLKDIREFADAVRKHWVIENKLHWCLDVIFREDAARARKDNSPLNMNVLRKNALSLVNQAKYGRISKKKMMFKAALNPGVLLRILFGSEK